MKNLKLAFAFFIRFLLKLVIRLPEHISWRMDRPYLITEEEKVWAQRKALPGDIILVKRNYELSNWFIPGRWKHVALVCGEGKIVEANENGVVTNHIKNFLSRYDEFLILRPVFATVSEKKIATEIALRQVGKDYDYDFEFYCSKNKSFYCSELVWFSYHKAIGYRENVFKPTVVLGRRTIVPQDFSDDNENWWRV